MPIFPSENRTPRQEFWLTLWAMAAAFGAYFCMYAFRKPFEVGDYKAHPLQLGGQVFAEFTLLVSAQTLGYTLAKFLGIKVVSEMRPGARVSWLLGLIGGAELALLGFALVPPPWNFVFLFLNGLALGMVFGLVMGFLEGRQTTEALLAALCASFIVASGVVKSVGEWLLVDWQVDRYWMPALTGLLFVPPLVLFAGMLAQIPPPSPADILQRSQRVPMDRRERWAFFRRYALGLTLLVGFYLLLTILRTVRDVYAKDIWRNLGEVKAPSVFARSEMLVGLAVVSLNGLAVIFHNHRTAFFVAVATSAAGLLLGLAGLLGHDHGWLPGFWFMVLLGIGLYLPYVAFHTTLLDRLVALLRDRGTIGFLMYMADSFGYLGYVVYINVAGLLGGLGEAHFMDFFRWTNYCVIAVSLVVLGVLALYFARRTGGGPPPQPASQP